VVVLPGCLTYEAGSFVLTRCGSRGDLSGHDHFAIVEFEEAGAEVLAAEVGHEGFVFVLLGHFPEVFGGFFPWRDGTVQVLL
jgi:hypothetical protein